MHIHESIGRDLLMAAMEEGNGLKNVDSSQYGSISNFEIEKKIILGPTL